MKKLLLVSPSFPKDVSDSYVIPFLQHVFLAFKEKYPELELTIVAIHKPISENYLWHGIRVIPLKGNNVKHPWKLVFLCRAFFKLYRLISKEKFDGILNFWYNDFSIFTHAIHSNTFTWMLGQDVRKSNVYLRMFQPNPNNIMALSEFNNNVLFETAKIRAHKVIPIAINEKLFPELNRGTRNIQVFGAGNLNSVKNYRLFLEIILELKSTFPNIKTEIAGMGEEESSLKDFVKANQLEHNVTFLGMISHQATLEKMNDSLVFLHPSTFEGGPVVYFEALYSGCQLVGMLPMMDKTLENFHCHQSKTDIVNKIKHLLKTPIPAKRVTYYPMDYVCQEIYELYFKSE
ncbi:glycosyltransferase [Flavobacterium sp. CYK-4]|uniref:glycosyltransferase n=1 Tax=Flavobacterium lotistagni TaxID=2709660 RepID=UPI00140C2DC9|nr:glycosyltransferase [Flavobacterium lotistagni]NHM05882.1 glycosyltransferase [Flavobacterium lotistagni]